MLTGLRGVGKTVLLNALRGQAVRKGWGTGKLEARPDQSLRRPLSSALHQAVRELAHPEAEQADQVLGVIRSFAERQAGPDAKLRDRWSPGIDVPAVRGRADSGDVEIDLVELMNDVGGLAADLGKGVAVCIDEMQDLGPDDVSALCAACHEVSQSGLPVIVVGAGLPHLPGRAEREQVLLRAALLLPAHRPALPGRGRPGAHRAGRRGGRGLRRGRAGRDVRRHRRLPLLHPGLRQDRLGPRPPLADHRRRRRRRRARGRARAGGRLLRQPLRAGHARRARLPARDGRRGRARRPTRSARSPPPTWPACSAGSRRRSPRPATRCSRRG